MLVAGAQGVSPKATGKEELKADMSAQLSVTGSKEVASRKVLLGEVLYSLLRSADLGRTRSQRIGRFR